MTLAVRAGARLPRDPWVVAASAVRHAALTTDGVAALSESALYQTQGPGQSVRGVAVTRGTLGAPRISVGVIVDADIAADPDRLAGVCRRVRAASGAAWARAMRRDRDGPRIAPVTVHVVDISHAATASSPAV